MPSTLGVPARERRQRHRLIACPTDGVGRGRMAMVIESLVRSKGFPLRADRLSIIDNPAEPRRWRVDMTILDPSPEGGFVSAHLSARWTAGFGTFPDRWVWRLPRLQWAFPS